MFQCRIGGTYFSLVFSAWNLLCEGESEELHIDRQETYICPPRVRAAFADSDLIAPPSGGHLPNIIVQSAAVSGRYKKQVDSQFSRTLSATGSRESAQIS